MVMLLPLEMEKQRQRKSPPSVGKVAQAAASGEQIEMQASFAGNLTAREKKVTITGVVHGIVKGFGKFLQVNGKAPTMLKCSRNSNEKPRLRSTIAQRKSKNPVFHLVDGEHFLQQLADLRIAGSQIRI